MKFHALRICVLWCLGNAVLYLLQILCPEIDIIDYKSFEYKPAPSNLYGAFDWKLRYVWKDIPQEELDYRADVSEPIRLVYWYMYVTIEYKRASVRLVFYFQMNVD